MLVRDLGLIAYRDAWALQEEAHARALAGGEETLLLLEHTPVVTFGRRAEAARKNLLASREVLAAMGVEVVESDRGGDITFHGPGQLVAYPVLRLGDRGLTAASYVHRLEDVVIAVLADYAVASFKDPHAPGVWVRATDPAALPGLGLPPAAAKVCALGVRIKRGISMHGIALNLSTDLRYFELINPCGLGKPVTTLGRLLGERAPTMADLKAAFARRLAEMIGVVSEPL